MVHGGVGLGAEKGGEISPQRERGTHWGEPLHLCAV